MSTQHHHRLQRNWRPAAGDRSRTVVIDGDARQVLPDVAEKENAALLVVGAGNASWFPAMHLGSVSHHLAAHCDRPLCVAPRSCEGFDATRIVVGLDGSRGSEAAVKWAAALAQRAAGTVVAVHAWGPAVSRIAQTPPDVARRAAEEAGLAWSSILRDAAVATELIVEEEGNPAASLARAVEQSRAGLAVAGTRGSGGFHDLRLGSVALRLLQHGVVPIVLVPPPG